MKKLIAILIFSIFFLFGCERIKVKKTYYPNGKLKEEWEVTQDKFGEDVKNGLYKAWYDDGQPKHEIHYLDGKKHGIQKSYHKNGQLELEENYLFGKLSGKKKNWTKEGKLELEVDYMDGKPHGLFVRYRDNGQIHHKINYLNGLKNGAHEIYDIEGDLSKTTWFAQGKMTDGVVDSSLAAAKSTDISQPGVASDSGASAASAETAAK